MIRYIVRRLLYGLITIWIISVVIFSVIHMLPGDPIQLMFGKTPNPERIAIVRSFYGLDKPLISQYGLWLTNIVRGNFGISIVSGQLVTDLVLPRISSTLLLTFTGLLFSICIAFPSGIAAAQTTRMVRTNILEIMRLDYITLMRSFGVRENRLLNFHVFKNVLIPVMTQIGMQAGALMGGVIIIERVFTYPGLGLLMMRALQDRDYPVLQACIMVFALVYVVFNLVVDILYCMVNPKIRY